MVKPKPIQFRPSVSDQALINEIKKKSDHFEKNSELIRYALFNLSVELYGRVKTYEIMGSADLKDL